MFALSDATCSPGGVAPDSRSHRSQTGSKRHPDFVRFVNAVLAKMRANGQWAASYARWIGAPVPAPPKARYR